MKAMTKYITIVAVCLAVVLQSCNKDSFNINANPNQPTDSTVSYNVILPSALASTGRYVARNWGWLQNYMGFWARSGTYAPAVQEETYQLNTNFQTQIWTNAYDNNFDYQTMQTSAEKAGADFYAGIARIMKAHNYQILVDFYNNIPYSQALKGNGNTTPKYDKGLDVYKDLFRQIDTGIALIKGASTSATGPNKNIVTDDIMFGSTNPAFPGGSATVPVQIAAQAVRWAKFGNTLKLRLLMHLCNGGATPTAPTQLVPGINIPAEFAVITTEGSGFLSTGTVIDAQVNPGYRIDKPNPFYNLYVKDASGAATQNSVYYKANKYATDNSYTQNADARINTLYIAGSDGFKGVAYGLPSSSLFSADRLAGIGNGLTGGSTGYAKSQWIITAAESYFLQAESINRGFLPGSAAATLNAGIVNSFLFLGNTAAEANALITGNAGFPDVDYNATAANTGYTGGLATIIEQKWYALNGIAPYEVYSDYRRMSFSASKGYWEYGTVGGHPAGPPISVSPSNTVTKLPTRLFYPQNEYNYNPANASAEGTITIDSKVFWDLR